MANPLERLLSDPWQLLNTVVDGPLHPGGDDATRRLLDRAGVERGTRVLDVGCGRGNALQLARNRGADAIGLDRHPKETGIVRGDVTALPFRAESIDAVLSECVLCLSPDLEATLRDVNRLLCPDGRLAFSDMTVDGDPPAVPSPFDGMLCLDGNREFAHIEQQIEHTGFEIESVETHREDILEMRDRLTDALDYDRLITALGARGPHLRKSATKLEEAVEEERIGYVSIVARSVT